MTDLFRFEWPIDQAGYDLVHIPAQDGEGTLSVSAEFEHDEIRPRGGPLRYYRPLDDHPGLWRRFADGCGSVAGAFAFVTDFGLLGHPANFNGDERPDDIIAFAGLVRRITDCLDAGEREAAAVLFTEHARPSLTAGIVQRERRSGFEFKLVPRDLISAILVQAGEAITGNRRFRRCKNCAVWFPLGPGGHTERREFCSDRCRVASARRHRRETTANA
jgi:hypothetical protein